MILRRLGQALCIAATVSCAGFGTAWSQSPPVTLSLPYFASVSGPAAPFQSVVFPPTQMAMEDLAKEGVKFDYTVVDSRLDPKTAVSEFQRRAGSAVVVMGPVFSTEFAAIAPIANRMGIPIVSGGASNADIARQNRPWVFMLNPDPRPQAKEGVAAWLRALPTVKSIVIIRDQKDVSTKLQADLITEGINAAGATVAETISFETGATDFSSIVTRSLQSKPDGVVIAALSNDATAIVLELRRQKVEAQLLAAPAAFTPTFVKNAGDAAVGVYTYTSFWPGDPNPRMRSFVERYRALTGLDPNFSSGFNYESWILLGAAVRMAGLEGKPLADQRAAMLKALQGVSIEGLQGTAIRFNADGFVDRPVLLLRITSGSGTERVK